jgi:hypothetical protein
MIEKTTWGGEETYRIRIGSLWFGENFKTKEYFIIWNGRFINWQIISYNEKSISFWKH